MTHDCNYFTPWSLQIEPDVDEELVTIRNARGSKLAESRLYWDHVQDELVPLTMPAYRLMTAAPKLLDACRSAYTVLANSAVAESKPVTSRDQIVILLRNAIDEATRPDG